MISRRTLPALAIAAALVAAPAAAQVFTRPHLPWRTIRTEHFTVHYPAELQEWTLDLAQRLEPVHDEVAALVGYAPAERVTIVVEDPSGVANGFAYPYLGGPSIALWPTPPDPRSALGNNRDPGEQLVVHEFAHVAHLTRPARNPREPLLWRLSPVRVGPLARKSPRWLSEGYATWVEGRLTGSGRPYSVIRAAILRQWALEGRLPTYAQMSAGGGYQGGAMAYLAGSAYLDWLAAQRGDSSLVSLWRRMSARRERGFDEAFTGVYGGSPAELYGRFTVDVTERALAARGALRAAGIVTGDTVQRLAWSTGDPALSPDGRQMAIVLRGAPGVPSRVVVWSTADARTDTADARAARELLAKDPQDVPDVRWKPAPKRAFAVLYPVNGRAHDQPRFMPDGRRILLIRNEPLGDGALRPDLFIWDWRRKSVHRVTHGAGIRWADPSPDGRSAAAVRCLDGTCDLVIVDLATGAIRTLVDAPPWRVLYRPRWSPDGRAIALAVQERGAWRVALADPSTGALRYVGADDGASRYDAAFADSGRALVLVSERGGVANLERIDLASGATRTLTRVTGAALAPEPDRAGGRIFYLSMHAGGLDLMRIRPGADGADARVVALDTALAPVARRIAASTPDTLPRLPAPVPHAYGLGPRRLRVLPQAGTERDGTSLALVLVNGDPVGRLTAVLRGVASVRGNVTEGVAANIVWRGRLPAIGLDAFSIRHRPERERVGADEPQLDAAYSGATLYQSSPWAGSSLRRRLHAGVSAGRLSMDDGSEEGARLLAFVDGDLGLTRTRGRQSLSLAATLSPSAGRTFGRGWTREVATLGIGVSRGGLLNLRGQATGGWVSGGAPAWERFSVGGAVQPLIDNSVLAQRIPQPVAPFGVVRGRQLLAYRVSTSVRGLTPYLFGASVDDGFDSWYRVAGVDATFDFPAFNLLQVPGVRVQAGAGLPLTQPERRRLQAYLSVTYRP